MPPKVKSVKKPMQYPAFIKDREDKHRKSLNKQPDSGWTKFRKGIARKLGSGRRK